MIRQPIISILGHVDHGKTSVLDKIRGSAVAAREAGGITQAIGASIIPLSTVKKVCGPLLQAMKSGLDIPGLLFIDTPGHAAFVNLRKRGGNLADIAILVVDITEGLKPQTIESLQILKQYKTPFLIVANKVDLVSGFVVRGKTMLETINSLPEQAQRDLDVKLYELVGQLSEHGFNADRFDRVSDYTQQLAIIPASAKTGDGIPELLMVLVGLTKKYLEKRLETDHEGHAKGTVLEVKEEKGLGKTVDVILYDGSLHVGDTLIIGGVDEAVVTKVKCLLEPHPLKEMREKKAKFQHCKVVQAATGVKIGAPNLDKVIAGMPLVGIKPKEDSAPIVTQLQEEVREAVLTTDERGLVVKADSLGSLEALLVLLREKNIPVVKASVGMVTKKDISDAEAAAGQDVVFGAMLCFNVPKPDGVLPESVHVIAHEVIYQIIEDYEKWRDAQNKKVELQELDKLTKPAKVHLMKGYVFRQSNPAVVGVEVVAGTIRSGSRLMKSDSGSPITTVKSIQKEQESVTKAEKNAQVALSLSDVVVGRQIKEDEYLYTFLLESEFRRFKELKKHLNNDQKEVLREIAEIMRKKNPVWGI